MENLNDIKTFDDISQPVKNMFLDIGAGICYTQKLADAEKGTYDLSKVKQYQTKTKIPKIIKEILEESDYRKAYKWQHDKEFISDGVKFEVIKYNIKTDDWCLVLMDGKEVKMTKKNLKEWWEERDC